MQVGKDSLGKVQAHLADVRLGVEIDDFDYRASKVDSEERIHDDVHAQGFEGQLGGEVDLENGQREVGRGQQLSQVRFWDVFFQVSEGLSPDALQRWFVCRLHAL